MQRDKLGRQPLQLAGQEVNATRLSSVDSEAPAPASAAPAAALSIDVEASIDPPPPFDVESLAAYLYRHAETARQRRAALEAQLATEDAAEGLVLAETEALRAELQQYHGWLAEEVEGGYPYRLSKELHEERQQRVGLEEEVASLKAHLSGLAAQVQELARQARGETVEQQQARAANEALTALERLRRISAGAVAAAHGRQPDEDGDRPATKEESCDHVLESTSHSTRDPAPGAGA